MFRFSCFHSPTNSQKSKKTVNLPTELMQKSLEDYNTNKPTKIDPVFSKIPEINNANPSPVSMSQDWKSEGLKSNNVSDTEKRPEIRKMRKSVSLGSGLAAYQDMTSGDESDGYQKPQASNSPQISSNMVNQNASDLSPDYLHQSEKEIGDNSETHVTGPHTGRSSPHTLVKSNSLPYLHSGQPDMGHQSQSDSRSSDPTAENDDAGESENSPEREAEIEHENKSDEFEYGGSAKDWVVPTVNEVDKGKSVQEDYSDCQWEQLPNEAFKIKRIEKWVMDLQHSSSLEEANTDLDHDHDHDDQNAVTTSTIMDPKADPNKGILGMDAAKRYISSLNASATSAQLANHGLVVIPFFSAFTSLKALNLSGNSIVRVTAGALPRGLHILNLSKNSISTIEGLRELTRLRVLDLSYNRILRIGHGLASCCSLKELYLAGNKISEVEGLHRLLKLNVLDLRFNKLSTTKSLGQLAANYNSLQAISLEGNPAQKNIGDEQLKKFLVALLPHLAYFNRQSMKTGGMKDSADRAARLGISAHQSDRGSRGDLKKSSHGRKGGGARGRHVRLPPSGVKVSGGGDRNQFAADVTGKLEGFRPDNAMRRTHSEGLLKAA